MRLFGFFGFVEVLGMVWSAIDVNFLLNVKIGSSVFSIDCNVISSEHSVWNFDQSALSNL